MTQFATSSPQAYNDLIAQFERSAKGWTSGRRPARWFSWATFARLGVRAPTQGWKVHLSCASSEATDFVQEALPTLFDAPSVAGFKVPASMQGVLSINGGMAGATQAGKLVTIYPVDTASIEPLIERLAHLWVSDNGPRVISDLPVAGGHGIYIRYGLFSSESFSWDSLGRPQSDLRTSEGLSSSDVRSVQGEQPSWAPTPPACVATIPAPLRQDDRYINIAALGSSPRSTVSLALDTNSLELVVVKEGRRGIMSDLAGNDAVTRLRNEREQLQAARAAKATRVTVLEYKEGPENAVLVRSYLPSRLAHENNDVWTVEDLGSLCEQLAKLHDAGRAHRDVKLSNLVRTVDGVDFLDFELSAALGETCPIPGGTPGYIPPEGTSAVVTTAIDIFALGGTLFEAATGLSPAQLPLADTAGRMLGVLSDLQMSRLRGLIAKVVIDRPEERASLTWVREQLARLPKEDSHASLNKGAPAGRPDDFRFAVSTAARAIERTRDFRKQQVEGTAWTNSHLHVNYLCKGLNLGAPGIILGLLTIDQLLGRADNEYDVLAGATWLAEQAPEPSAHGLFTGNASVALALGIAGRRFGRADFSRSALAYLEAASKQRGDFDLFSGSAGILWCGCLLSNILRSEEPLTLVERQADDLLDKDRRGNGTPVWESSVSFDPRKSAYFGAAHGSAGIALALATWGSRTGCTEASEAARNVFLGLSALVDSVGSLPEGPDRPSRPELNWCHGTAGLLWCAIQAQDCLPELASTIAGVADGFLDKLPLLGNPTLCHGMAGVLDLMRMLEHAISDPRARQNRLLARRLLRRMYWRGETGPWSSESTRDVTPDLWVGFLGPASSLLLDAYEVDVPLMSSRWLDNCANAT